MLHRHHCMLIAVWQLAGMYKHKAQSVCTGPIPQVQMFTHILLAKHSTETETAIYMIPLVYSTLRHSSDIVHSYKAHEATA